jgi:trehalose utilization protein
MDKPRVTVWNEYRHEKMHKEIEAMYPGGIHGAIADHLRTLGLQVGTATLDEPQHGLTEEVLENTDVLLWWGHAAHGEVKDEVVSRVYRRVMSGMGLIVLHSGHFSKIFVKLMGSSCDLKWREAGERERIWVVDPGHPIASGLGEYFEIPHAEMYGERFDIPQPDQLVFVSWFQGGEVFRSGCCFHRGAGKIFYFRPGHETYPIFHQEEVLQVIGNAVHWAAPNNGPAVTFGQRPDPLEKFEAHEPVVSIAHPELSQ